MRDKLNRLTALCAAAVLLALPAAAAAGSIKGKVSVTGLRTPENIVVYLSTAPAVDPDLSQARFVMDQQNLAFRPHVLPIPVGASVLFPNNDKVDHNVFSMSLTKKFNLGSYKPGESKTVVFDKPGVVELRCDVHAEMAAYILVMKSPYFAVTDRQGNFEIPDPGYLSAAGVKGVGPLPAGKYTVKTWHEKLKSARQTVQVPAEGEVEVNFSLTRGVPGALFK